MNNTTLERLILKYIIMFLILISAKAFALQDFEIIYDEKTGTKKLISNRGNTPELRKKLAEHYKMVGLMNHQEMNLDDAIFNYEISVRYIPNAEVLADMAECYIYMNNTDSAFVCIENAKKIDSTEKRIYQVLVDYHAKINDKVKAIEYATYLTRIDTSQRAKLRLAYLYQDVNIMKSAEIVQECIDKDSGNSELYLYLMDIYNYVQDGEKYERTEEKFMVSPNKKKETMLNVANTYLENNSIRSIVKYIDTLQAYIPEDKFLDIVRFVYPYTIYHDLMTDKGVDRFLEISKNLEDEELKNAMLGNLYLLKNEIRKGWEYQDKIIRKKTTYTLFSILANMTANQPMTAIKQIKNNLDILEIYNAEQENAITNLLYSYYEYETLRKVLIKQWNRNPNDSLYYIRIGDISNLMGDNKSAYEWYSKAVEVIKDDAVVLNNYAYFLAIGGGDLNIAEECADKAVKLMPNSYSNLDTYGWVLYLKGRHKDAEKYLLQSLKLFENGETHYHLAIVYLRQKKFGLYAIHYLKSIEKAKVLEKLESKN